VAPIAVVGVLALVGSVAAIATLDLVTLEVSGVEEGAVLRPADVRDLEIRVAGRRGRRRRRGARER
jgi:hypothetical protein